MPSFWQVGEWRQWVRGIVYEEPLIGGVHELMEEGSIDDARSLVDSWPDEMSIRDVYLYMQERLKPVLLVDKVRQSPQRKAGACQLLTMCFLFVCSHRGMRNMLTSCKLLVAAGSRRHSSTCFATQSLQSPAPWSLGQQ